MIERFVYPVGQGEFYSEAHRITQDNTVVVVYDCGSDTPGVIDREVSLFGYSTIDYFVISHFHRDHTSGISKLIERGITIKNLIVPKITNGEKVLYSLEANGKDIDMYFNPGEYWHAEKFIEVESSSEASEFKNDSSNRDITHKADIPIHNNCGHWILRFYVEHDRYNALDKREREKLEKFAKEDLKDKSKTKEIRAVYNKISKDTNHTTMCMYSGPKFPKSEIRNVCNCYHEYYGTLLTGDADFSNERNISKLVSHYGDVKNSIRSFDVPHHGSNHNTTRVIHEFKIENAFIQAGLINKHGHPSGVVINILNEAKVELNIVNEKSTRLSI